MATSSPEQLLFAVPALDKQPTAGYLTSAETQPLTDYYLERPSGLLVAGGCSDDRGPTRENALALDTRLNQQALDNILPVSEGYTRFWGSPDGLAVVALGTAAVLHGEKGIALMGGISDTSAAIRRATANRFMGHSDTANEGNVTAFDASNDNPKLGCLLANAVGAGLELLATHDAIREQVRKDQLHVLGNEENVEQVLSGLEHVRDHVATLAGGDATKFAVTRTDFGERVEQGSAVMVLDGSHATVDTTSVIANFVPGRISNPTAANQAGKPFYDANIVTALDEIGPFLQERGIGNAGLLTRTALALTTVVRAALVAHDPTYLGQYDPTKLRLGVHGDAHKAIAYLDAKYGF